MKTQLYNEVEFNVNGLTLSGNLIIPETAIALVIFSHSVLHMDFIPAQARSILSCFLLFEDHL